ncbi:hypothetical protein [Stenotrophomonas sp. 24(2023)]|uniref:hypothetical protein n=1 Tax=Stenotrophomonas sp. 24(2023) TaxID=3068324 RepID=UPI0027DEB7E6|nr:hypothetical protein [Stenotrophomonas sp. 24(2023)]WMJ71323.1 hypothetical protein Q9R17_09575 [Stenotrophomonas sp. 24(2023)]
MSVGLEVINDSGVPVLVNAHAFAFFAAGKGVQSIGSNTSPLGESGSVSLPQQSVPYLVFIRCNGGSTRISSGNAGFSWNMAQGTTSFEWWAWGRAVPSNRVGMQVVNADGSLQWDMSSRPLRMAGLVNMSGARAPIPSETSNDNILVGDLVNGPGNNLAYLLSDVGLCHDVYAVQGGGPTIRTNMRYMAAISTPTASHLRVNFCRRAANRQRSLSGASYQTFASRLPSYVLAAYTY